MEIILQQKCSDFQKYFSSKVFYTVLLHSNWSFSKEALWRGMVWLERKTPPKPSIGSLSFFFLLFFCGTMVYTCFQICFKKWKEPAIGSHYNLDLTCTNMPGLIWWWWCLSLGVIASSAPTSFFFFLLNCNQISLMWCITNYWGCRSKHNFALSFFFFPFCKFIRRIKPFTTC